MIGWIIFCTFFGLVFYFLFGMIALTIFSDTEISDYEFYSDDPRTLAYLVFWPVLVGIMLWKFIAWFTTTLPKSIAASIGYTFKSFNIKDKLISKD